MVIQNKYSYPLIQKVPFAEEVFLSKSFKFLLISKIFKLKKQQQQFEICMS